MYNMLTINYIHTSKKSLKDRPPKWQFSEVKLRIVLQNIFLRKSATIINFIETHISNENFIDLELNEEKILIQHYIFQLHTPILKFIIF